jgi:hypothetical protein
MIAIQKPSKPFELNNSIAVMLRSYTRAINLQERRSGALFREGTKADFLDTIESGKLKMKNRSSLYQTVLKFIICRKNTYIPVLLIF